MRTNKEILAVVNQMVSDGQIAQDVAEKYFPELKESEDEKMRNGLLKYLKDMCKNTSTPFSLVNAKLWIAWLERQGEQKSVVIPKFRVGDIIRLKGTVAEYTIKKVTDTTYYTNGWSCSIERCEEDYELVEQKPVWGEEDETTKNNKR